MLSISSSLFRRDKILCSGELPQFQDRRLGHGYLQSRLGEYEATSYDEVTVTMETATSHSSRAHAQKMACRAQGG